VLAQIGTFDTECVWRTCDRSDSGLLNLWSRDHRHYDTDDQTTIRLVTLGDLSVSREKPW